MYHIHHLNFCKTNACFIASFLLKISTASLAIDINLDYFERTIDCVYFHKLMIYIELGLQYQYLPNAVFI